MKRVLCILVATLAVATFFPKSAYANDASVQGGTGGTVYPIYDTDVEMEEEIIDILVKDGKTFVTCQFFFHNTGEATELHMGFPTEHPGWYRMPRETDKPGEDDYGDFDEFDDMPDVSQLNWFRTFVQGKRVHVKIKKGLEPEGHNYGDLYYPQWYTWKMQFKADERIKVVNKYWMVNSYFPYDVSENIEYILRTGSTWKNAIGKVTVKMRFFGYDMCHMSFRGMKPAYIDKKGTILWEADDIEPVQDIRADYFPLKNFDQDSMDQFKICNPFDYGEEGYEPYDAMGRRMLKNFYAKHYNGTTWWGNKFLKKFGDMQSSHFYYLMGLSYYRLGKNAKALDMLNKVSKESDDLNYYIQSLYYKALILRKTRNTESYRECLDQITEYYSQSQTGNTTEWIYLWAQSRLADLINV